MILNAAHPPLRRGPRRTILRSPRRQPIWLATFVFSLFAALIPIARWALFDRRVEFAVWSLFLIFLALCILARRVKRPPLAGVWLSALVLIPLGGLVSGITTSVPASLLVAVPLALLIGLAPPVLRYYVDAGRRFTWCVCSAFVLSQTVSAVVGLLQLNGTNLFGTSSIFGRATGLADHPNVLGVMAVFAILASCAAVPTARIAIKLLAFGVIAINFAALIGTGSLSAMLAGAVAGLIALIVKRRTLLAVALAVISAGILSVFLGVAGLDPASLLEPVGYRFNVVLGAADDGGAASVGTRVQTYEWAWRFISENPLVGVGMDATNAATYNGYTPVHNYVLQAWYRGGLFFMVWQLTATAGYVYLIARAIRGKRRAIAAAMVAAVVTFAATSAFFDQPHYWLPLLFAMVLLPSARDKLQERGTTQPRSGVSDAEYRSADNAIPWHERTAPH